jgi:hypothetical protein
VTLRSEQQERSKLVPTALSPRPGFGMLPVTPVTDVTSVRFVLSQGVIAELVTFSHLIPRRSQTRRTRCLSAGRCIRACALLPEYPPYFAAKPNTQSPPV